MCMYRHCPSHKGKDTCTCPTDLALFLVRLGLAAVFIVHGWGKFAHMEATVGFFGTIGLPALVAYLVAAIELLGGIALLLGIGTTFAGIGLAIVMIGAIVKVKWAQGFSGGWEFDLVLLLSALAVAAAGPGCISIHKLLKGGASEPARSRSSKESPAAHSGESSGTTSETAPSAAS